MPNETTGLIQTSATPIVVRTGTAVHSRAVRTEVAGRGETGRSFNLVTSVAEDGRPDPDERRALLDGDPVVLARAHRQVAQAVLVGKPAQPAEVRPRRLG